MTVLKDSLVTSLYDDGLSAKDRQLLLELACSELEARYLMVPRMLIFYLSVMTIVGVGGLALTQGFAFVGSVFWLFLSLAIAYLVFVNLIEPKLRDQQPRQWYNILDKIKLREDLKKQIDEIRFARQF